MTVRLLEGDVRAMLATLEPNSVQTCVTSPPYWGLRSYGTEPQVWGGDPEHAHEWGDLIVRQINKSGGPGKQYTNIGSNDVRGNERHCPCGAWLGEMGSEPTPELYVQHIVEVFRAVWRVLRPDGTAWINLGFSYAGSGKGWGGGSFSEQAGHTEKMGGNGALKQGGINSGLVPNGYKPKDLIPIPFLVAMALQADGWYWRSTIVWAKRAPMPESVTDRPTSAWEPILLMSKARSYFYDADAVREPSLYPEDDRKARSDVTDKRMPTAVIAGIRPGSAVYPSRNMRNVWLLGDQRVRLRSDLSPEQRAYVLERLAAHMRRGLP